MMITAILCMLLIGVQRVKTFGDAPTLRMLHVLWRHGDRTPVHFSAAQSEDKTAANFITKEVESAKLAISKFLHHREKAGENDGHLAKGALTQLGMQQHYELGSFIRKSYDQFLGTRYSPDEVYIRSSDLDRTIQSAQANMQALYAGDKSARIFSKTPTVLIPVHSVPQEYDNIINMAGLCPKEPQIWTETRPFSKKLQEITDENWEFLKFIAQKINVKVPTIFHVTRVFDALIFAKNHRQLGLWPDWMTNAYWERLVKLSNDLSMFWYSETSEQRLRGGPLLNDAIQRMESKVAGNTSLKFYAYSGHDLTIVALLESLGAYVGVDAVAPPYASAVFIELHVSSNGVPYVEIYYRKGQAEKVHQVSVKSCRFPCTLESLRQRSEHLFVSNWNEECKKH